VLGVEACLNREMVSIKERPVKSPSFRGMIELNLARLTFMCRAGTELLVLEVRRYAVF
jgi:hypothetical protein